MKGCEKIRDEILLHLDAQMPGVVQKHLDECHECSAFLKEMKKARGLLQDLEPLSPPPGLQDKIMRKVEKMEERNFYNRLKDKLVTPWQVRPAILVAMSLVLVFVIGGVFYLWQPFPERKEDMLMQDVFRAETLPMERQDPRAPDTYEGMELKVAERRIIYNAMLELEVSDADKLQGQVIEYITVAGGFVAETRRWVSPGGEVSIRMVLRLPVVGFEDALGELAGLGEVVDQSIQGRDITREYQDLEARIGNKKQQEQRYLEILQEAKNVEEILKIERELERIRVEIESMEGTLRYYQDRSDFATITLTMKEPQVVIVGGELFEAIREAFKGSVHLLFTITGWILPYAAILMVILLITAVFKSFKTKK